MPSFSARSRERLATCDVRLVQLFNEVIVTFDCTILQGHRGRDEQNEAYRKGLSTLKWPRSKHNSEPSRAVDVMPYPIDWEDTRRATYFAGFVMGMAREMGIPIRWGGDWDRDTQVKDNRFNDLPHYELIGTMPPV